MKEKNIREDSTHGKHPVRSFFHFLFTLLSAAAFCTLFYALSEDDTALAALAGAIVASSALVGIVDALLPKRR